MSALTFTAGTLVRDTRFEGEEWQGVVELASGGLVIVRWRAGPFSGGKSYFEISAAERFLRPVAPSLGQIFGRGGGDAG